MRVGREEDDDSFASQESVSRWARPEEPAAGPDGNVPGWVGWPVDPERPPSWSTPTRMRQGSEVGAAGADQVTEASGKWRASATTGWHAAHIPGSVNVPTHDIPVAGAELPRGTALAVHCGHDYRATLGASLLERAGYHQLVVDDGWEGWSPRDHDAL